MQQQQQQATDPITDLHAAITAGQLPVLPQEQTDTLTELEKAAQQTLRPQTCGPPPLQRNDLGPEQRAAVDAVIDALDAMGGTCTLGPGTHLAKPLLMTLQGGPGCGKSAVTRHLVDQLRALRTSVLVTATTATAAQRLLVTPADTVHSACQVPVYGNLTPMYQLSPQTIALRLADIVIRHEFSMLTSKTLSIVMNRMAQATPQGAHRKVLLLVGDLGQLPPICRHGSRRRTRQQQQQDDGDDDSSAHQEQQQPGLCPTCHLLRNQDFQAAQHLRLTQVYSQAEDFHFAEFLNEVRDKPPTAARLREVLGEWYRPAGSLEEQLDATATVLCTHNRDVSRHNRTALMWHCDKGDLKGQLVHKVHMQHNAAAAGPAAAHRIRPWLNTPHFHNLKQVAEGARVIFDKTVNKSTGQTNSAVGTVTAIHWADEPPEGVQLPAGKRWIEKLSVQLPSRDKPSMVSRSKLVYTHRDGMQFSKRTFPLLLAYAMTAHRCQGATLTGRVILDVRRAFAPAIVYIMLSKATKRSNLRILGGLRPTDFVPVNEAAFKAWDAHQLQQIQDGEPGEQEQQQGGVPGTVEDDTAATAASSGDEDDDVAGF